MQVTELDINWLEQLLDREYTEDTLGYNTDDYEYNQSQGYYYGLNK